MTRQDRKHRIVLALSARAGEILSAISPTSSESLEDSEPDPGTQRLLAEILDSSSAERKQTVVKERRFHRQTLCRRLLMHAHSQLPTDFEAVWHFAELALSILDAMWPPTRQPLETHRDLVALAHAQMGHVLALQGSWKEAHARFDTAFEWLEKGAGEAAVTERIQVLYLAVWQEQERRVGPYVNYPCAATEYAGADGGFEATGYR